MNRQIISSRSSGKTQKLHCNLFFTSLFNHPVSEDWMDIIHVTSVNVNVSEKETKQINFDRPKTVVFLNFSKAYKKYIGYVYSPLGGQYLSYKDMKNLLQDSIYYTGETKAKRIGKEVHRCFIFDFTLIMQDFNDIYNQFHYSIKIEEAKKTIPTKRFIESQEELTKFYYVEKMQVEQLIYRYNKLRTESESIKKAIDSLQDICSHEFENLTSNPHFDQEQCKHCLKTRNI